MCINSCHIQGPTDEKTEIQSQEVICSRPLASLTPNPLQPVSEAFEIRSLSFFRGSFCLACLFQLDGSCNPAVL